MMTIIIMTQPTIIPTRGELAELMVACISEVVLTVEISELEEVSAELSLVEEDIVLWVVMVEAVTVKDVAEDIVERTEVVEGVTGGVAVVFGDAVEIFVESTVGVVVIGD